MAYEGSRNDSPADICSLALLELKRTGVVGKLGDMFVENVTNEEVDSWRVYEEARKSLLMEFLWPNFSRETKLQKVFDNWDEDENLHNEESFSYARGFRLPDDYLRDCYVKIDPILGPRYSEFQDADYKFIGNLICTDSARVYLCYVNDETDLTLWSSDFKTALAALIARLLARRYLDSDSREEILERKYQDCLIKLKAKSKNKTQAYTLAGYG